ncbi:hypothetical protein MKK84_00435 [Methylobacterium sp. E-065]|uniref:dCTP deaminase domain-containing protein n=1 Tax=Methylobacterium sp. E-065 TaxID=2836583 RepID=UPI001FBB0D0A|nr:hypothetical protein [Methylobacterium sp. E-065]MCJ2015908.1 hypothetical protein [Methylobacterium sp. E-065]
MDTPETGPLDRHAENEAEHKARARRFKSVDPLKSVPHGLLSSSEIHDYIRLTSMLDEFDEKHLKSASYEVFAGGEFIYWEKNTRKKKKITKKDYFLTLPANSITFVQTRTKFRLPSYIAIRFNLRITHVHRGLLLGTGPLVDPGFEGQLLVPLHNLTSTEYQIDLSEALIWIEFTKTTANFDNFSYEELDKYLLPNRKTQAVDFPKSKCFKDPDYYLFKANGGRPIVSSIPAALGQASSDAREAKESSESLQNWARGIGILAVLGAVLGVASALTSSWTMIKGAQESIRKADETVEKSNMTIAELKQKVQALEGKTPILQTAEDRITKLENSRDELVKNLARNREDADRTIAFMRREIDLLTKRLDERRSR